jgi:putative modified peptide
MEPSNVDKFLEKVAQDESFRQLCRENPAKALEQAGIEASAENVAALKDAEGHFTKMSERLRALGKVGPVQ